MICGVSLKDLFTDSGVWKELFETSPIFLMLKIRRLG